MWLKRKFRNLRAKLDSLYVYKLGYKYAQVRMCQAVPKLPVPGHNGLHSLRPLWVRHGEVEEGETFGKDMYITKYCMCNMYCNIPCIISSINGCDLSLQYYLTTPPGNWSLPVCNKNYPHILILSEIGLSVLHDISYFQIKAE